MYEYGQAQQFTEIIQLKSVFVLGNINIKINSGFWYRVHVSFNIQQTSVQHEYQQTESKKKEKEKKT